MLSEHNVAEAAKALSAGGVIAYPTEYCFGLGCDPSNTKAVERLLKIKERQAEQGVILIASEISQVEQWVDIEASPLKQQIVDSWPGPNTWLLPALNHVTEWVRGKHQTVAMRIPDHEICTKLCALFGGAIVSTSANRHGHAALLEANSVRAEMASELDYIIDASVSGAETASTIKHGITGEQIR